MSNRLSSPFDFYKAADTEKTAAKINYYGFIHSNGKWYILREDLSVPLTGAYRYATLSNNPTITGGYDGAGADKAWANRATLTYDYLDEVTGI